MEAACSASYAGLAPFLAFALFPFYWALITSLKADANLYDLKANPFWFASTDRTTGKPYHKDIIIPASLNEGVAPLAHRAGRPHGAQRQRAGPETDRLHRRAADRLPVDGTLSEATVAEGRVAHPNEVIGVIRVASPTLTHYRYLKSTPFYRWLKVSLADGRWPSSPSRCSSPCPRPTASRACASPATARSASRSS
mgnify:CR=1 FL=1